MDTDKKQPSREPILRLETGMHTAAIRRIGVDAENRWLVTASYDKTVRVWELPEGRLVKVLRPPIGDGKEGMIYAVAISPDGRTIACGGWTGWEWGNKTITIYFFDRESGNLIKTITGLPVEITYLAYSKDGRHLAAGLGVKYGIRIYSTRNYSQTAADENYDGEVYGADFDGEGRLVTTSFDGHIRLYNADFKLIAKEKSQGGSRPYQVSFSPDRSKIAVGFDDSTIIDVLSCRDIPDHPYLTLLYPTDKQSLGNIVDSGTVTWSSKDGMLYAGGTFMGTNRQINQHVIRRWDNGGLGDYVDISIGADDTITHILPLKNGGISFSTGYPYFGFVNGQGQELRFKNAFIADYRFNPEALEVSDDGFSVKFVYKYKEKKPAVFSVSERSLTFWIATGDLLKPPITSSSSIDTTRWEDTTEEQHRSNAIAPDDSGFLIGKEWYLYYHDRSGKVIWKVAAPATALAVNISGDGKIAVAAFGDGTIRWYRISGGEKEGTKEKQEFLTFFPHADKKRWVLWTPSGYYDATPGSEDLIGWHVNNGPEQAADFFPISKFKDKYYRPDVISKIIHTLDEAEAVRLANIERDIATKAPPVQKILPPVVKLLSPVEGHETANSNLDVVFSISSHTNTSITALKIYIDKTIYKTIDKTTYLDETIEKTIEQIPEKIELVPGVQLKKSIRIEIPKRDCIIRVEAIDENQRSGDAEARVKWTGRDWKRNFTVRPGLYVLAVGISDYVNENIRLKYAHKDAEDFAAAIEKQKDGYGGKDGLYRDMVINVIKDREATRKLVMEGFQWLSEETTSKDVAMIFLSGHGANDRKGLYYFIPADAECGSIPATCVAFSDIIKTIGTIKGTVVTFLDTCHSGNLDCLGGWPREITGTINELADRTAASVVFASSMASRPSYEYDELQNGAFTKALVEGINGYADTTGSNKILISDLDGYLTRRIAKLTGGSQTPVSVKPRMTENLPLFVPLVKDPEWVGNTLAAHKGEMREKFNVTELGVFGSYAKNTPKTGSDIDILVEFESTPDLFKFMRTKDYIEDLLKINVDLVRRNALRPELKNEILNSVKMI
jgi:predicted nucleotidyltransferase/WD40 repeat protein